jgi:exocyst complex component 4
MPLSSFDDVINSFFSLSSTCLFTLRTESRVQIIHRLQETLALHQHADRRPASTASFTSVAAADPQHFGGLHTSPPILSLNSYLVNFSEEIDNWVREREMRFLTKGLWLLIESQINRNFKEMVLKDAGEAEKQKALKQVELDLLVLHKNLTNVEVGLQADGNGLESLIGRLKL